LTNIILIVSGGVGILLSIYSFCFYWMLTDTAFDWRPPMRSHLHDDRAKRIIDLYLKNNDEFRRLYEAEHKKEIEEQRKLYEKSMGIEDEEFGGENENNNNNNNNNQGADVNEGVELPMVSKKKNLANEGTALKSDVDNNDNNEINNNNNNVNNDNNEINNQGDNNDVNDPNNNTNKKRRNIPKRHAKNNDDQQQ